ncbi:hypothetical protein N3K66_000311 [Trichothecium roseum]|uniref:Uncharacterized protein n=1 Tax=Trichothecium roseum TaxID=47278 RepID=A0ACC0VBM4_9HYPO|nr:hypothetical protein N3K66_000311 [Trichothecium roseum]
MSQIITVLGATGTQGGSVIAALLQQRDDPEQTTPYTTIRAVTRNPESLAARALAARGVQVLRADLDDPPSLRAAFAGTHAIFAVTNFFESLGTLGVQQAMAAEIRQGKNVADAAAVTTALEHFVWSTLPDSRANSGGAAAVPYYESKNAVDAHIRTELPDLLAKTTFLWVGWYAANILNPLFRPVEYHHSGGDGRSGKSYVQLVGVPPATTRIPMAGDEARNTGLWVTSILAQPRKTLPGKLVAATIGLSTFAEVLASYAEAQGLGSARCVQVGEDDYLAMWPGGWGELLLASTRYLALMGDKAFGSVEGEEGPLTKEDLGVEGLVGFAEAFANMPAVA